MPQPRPPFTYKPPSPATAAAKATASETIRAVRVIIGRLKPPQTIPDPEPIPVVSLVRR